MEGRGWVSALVNADVATPVALESFLKVRYIART